MRLAASSSAASVSCARLLLLLDGRSGRQFCFLKNVAVDLAGGQLGQRIEYLVAAGHHIGWQIAAQFAAHLLGVELYALVRHDEGDEFIDALDRAQNDGGLRDARKIGKLRLDLAELDAKTADLHLIVDAAAKIDVARLVHHDGVAGAVKDRVGRGQAEGIGDEFLGRQFVALQIAFCDAGAADQQLALDIAIEQVQRIVADICGVVRDRSADRHRSVGLDDRGRGDDGRFRRPVGIEDHAAWLAPARGDRWRTGFAAQNDDAQFRRILRQHGE